MRHRNDEDPLALYAIEKQVKEAWHHNAPKTSPDTAAACRKPDVAKRRALHEVDEIDPKVPCFPLEVLRGANQFRLSFGMEFEAPHRSEERALRNTSLAGMPATLPETSSSSRRSASSSHKRSLSGSA